MRPDGVRGATVGWCSNCALRGGRCRWTRVAGVVECCENVESGRDDGRGRDAPERDAATYASNASRSKESKRNIRAGSEKLGKASEHMFCLNAESREKGT